MKYLSEFRKRKGLDKQLNLSTIQVALECAAEANEIGYDYITCIDYETEKDGFITHVHLNLIGRIYEQIEGMLICIATHSFSSAEALARVIQESSINLMYMSMLGDERTITAFMAKWYDEHIKRLNTWKKEIVGKDYESQVLPMIDGRISDIKPYLEYIERAKLKFSVEEKEYNDLWCNKLFERFEKLGKAEDYFSIYHRLSGSSHMTAEDTILFMLALQWPVEVRQIIAFEACSYSIMMSRIVILSFVDAVAYCCIRHRLTDKDSIDKFIKIKTNLCKAIQEISKDAGIPRESNQEDKEI